MLGGIVRAHAILLLVSLLVLAANGSYGQPEGDGCVQNATTDQKFYLYELEAEKLCYSGAELLKRAKLHPPKIRQYLPAALFMRQQLEDHPRRTLDPSEATLFVLPGIFDIAAIPHPSCCKAPLKTILHNVTQELLASPHFQRNKGRDHLISLFDYRIKHVVFKRQGGMSLERVRGNEHHPKRGETSDNNWPSAEAVIKTFRYVVRKMVIATSVLAGGLKHGEMGPATITGEHRKIQNIVIPYLAPGAIDRCHAEGATGKIVCPNGYTGEETFESYKAARNNTVFFIGDGWRNEQPRPKVPGAGTHISRKRLRQLAIYNLEGLKWPSILADSSSSKFRKNAASPKCDFVNGNPLTGCRVKGVPAVVAEQMMSRSLLSLHIRGDDATSSRVYEAIASGTPQLFLGSRMLQDGAPFKCAMPWEEIHQPIDEMAFEKAPLETMERVLGELLEGEGSNSSSGRLGRIWSAQREAANDLLWHLPGSRVAHNVVEDAMRMVLLA